MIKKIIYLIVPVMLSVVYSTDIEYNLIFKYNEKKMTDEQIESVKSLKLKLQKKTLKSDNKIMLVPTFINADSERIKFYKANGIYERNKNYQIWQVFKASNDCRKSHSRYLSII